MRRVIYPALFAAIAAVTINVAAAAPQVVNTNKQATLVMKNGDRHTGTLVYHNNANFNLIENGQDRAYAIDDVAVLDFAGGNPAAAELAKLPASDNSSNDMERHMLVLRDGTVVHGRMYTITPTAITVNTQGGHQNFDLNNVSRLYVNPGTSRQLFASILNANAATVPTTGTTAAQAGAEIVVSSRNQWTSTGLTVRRGETLNFRTTGEIRLSPDSTDIASVAGSKIGRRPAANAPMPNELAGALIARIGNSRPFGIGDQTSWPVPASGQLFLGINDDSLGDNTGEFRVAITRTQIRR
jgi:hypothetical protein